MITIPANILALIKSRQQIGANRPTAVIEFGGQPSTASLKDPTQWTTWRVFTADDRGHGNICETSDGRAVAVYSSATDNSVSVAFAPTIAGVLDGSESFGAATTLVAGLGGTPHCSINLVAGKLRVVVVYLNTITDKYVAEYWADSDAKGADFAKVADISLNLTGAYGHPRAKYPSVIQQLGNGNLAVVLPWVTTSPSNSDAIWAHYSTDDGVTWISGQQWYGGLAAFMTSYYSRNLMPLGADNFLVVRVASSGSFYGLCFTQSGASFRYIDWVGDYKPYVATWAQVGEKIYMHYNSSQGQISGVFEFIGDTVTPEALMTMANYTLIKNVGDLAPYDNWHFLLATENALVLQGSSAGQISGAGTEISSQALRPKSLVVSRSKGSASQVSVSFENTGGKYAPDPAGPWNHVMWPNNNIKAYLGYGVYLPKVFTGLIDDVDMETPPQMISATARDHSKKALDQMCQWTWDGVTYYDGAWASQDPEGIFVALATMAGFAEADVVYDVTGIVIPEFRFKQQTYADLIQKLAEMSGCEWYCDEEGKIYFKLVTYPEATPAYSFVAGVDIFSLGYKISDAEIYRDVVVTAQGPEDENGNSETISVKVEWSAADYYGLPPHKTLYVTASDIVQDEAGCLEIANRMLLAMTTKPRQVQFVAVGIPNLQIGDCIQVTEASSTISEIYRVYDFEHQYDAEGSPVFATAIKCYWYAHGD